ncbi:MAG TPA: DUF3810 domain-containing protein [Mucilaginibacter sp.]
MRYQYSLKKFSTRIITIIVLAVLIFLLFLLASYPQLVERYYSEGLYPVICKILHPVLNLFPFSVGDVLYIAVTCYLVYAVIIFIRLLFKKEFKSVLILVCEIVIQIQAALLIFYLFWGMNYFRPSAGERLNLRDTNYTTSHLANVTCMLIDSANACRARITGTDTLQSNKTIYQTAIKAIAVLSADSADFRTYYPGIKSSLLTPVLNYVGTSGYYNPFTTEAQLNYQMPYFERADIACHEMSHQMGYGPEDEANFVGFLAGIGSKDRLLRYSAYQMAVDECMHALRYRDTTLNNELKTHISAPVRHDFKVQRAYWLAYRGKMELFSSIFYNNFLKVNNQPHGLDTYNQMVLLVMAWYGDNSKR